jgi:hypothetical protein
MRWSVVVAALALALPAEAEADRFAGFGVDGRYQIGSGTVCAPLLVRDGAAAGQPACAVADARAIAAGGFRTGAPEAAGGVRADASAYTITVTGADGAALVRWRAPAPVSRVIAVYVAPSGRAIAVEYEARDLGRTSVGAVAFALDRSLDPERAGTAAPPASPPATGAPERQDEIGGAAPAPPGAPGEPPGGGSPGAAEPPGAGRAARERGDALLAERRYQAAAAAFREALRADPGDADAGYGEAIALAQLGRRDAALAALEHLAALAGPTASRRLVDARIDPAFRGLRNDPRFRAAVGVDRAREAGELTAYERLVGHGGGWEQGAIPCERARVTLSLDTRPRQFSLVVDSRCQGEREVTRLGGQWDSEGAGSLLLVFPNPGAGEERAVCRLDRCQAPVEDCLRCRLAADLDLELRPVRRRR